MKRTFVVCLLAAVLTLPAAAASFGVKPNAVTIDAKTPVAEFSFSSLDAHTTTFEVRVTRWSQAGTEDTYTPADVAIVPAVFALSPYETRLVRMQPRGGPVPETQEQSYRVTILEVIAGQSTAPPSARRFVAVLFVAPRAPTGEATYAISYTGKTAVMTVTNGSNRHVYVGAMRIETNGGEIYRGPALGYVLAGATRTFPLTLTGTLASAAEAQLRFDDESGAQQSAALFVRR